RHRRGAPRRRGPSRPRRDRVRARRSRAPRARPPRSRSARASEREGRTMRRTAVLPALVAAPVLALVAHAGLVPSDAAWVDREWGAGATGTVDCSSPEGVAAGQARGRVLSGSLLGLDLDTLAALDGVVATSDGTEASASPGAASPVTGLDDAWADPLDLSAVLGIVALPSAGITL